MGTYVLPTTRHTVTTRMTAFRRAAVRQFNVSLIVWEKSQDSVMCGQSHKTVSINDNF